MEEGRISLTASRDHSGDLRLDGRVAVVTGSGSGIGRTIAKTFAASGAVVRVLDIGLEDAEATCQLIRNASGMASAHARDVISQRKVKSCLEELFAQGRVHILVNNAGVAHIGTAESTSEEDFDRVFRVNVKGYYNCMFAMLRHMRESGGGVILNMASVAGAAGLADRFAYSMSKGAVIAMTYSVARDYVHHNIRCNCISPARVHTPFVDDYLKKNLSMKRAGDVREAVEVTARRKDGGTGRSGVAGAFPLF